MDRQPSGTYDLAMQSGQPSWTALGAARHRAAHQVLEEGAIFTDPLALRILGADAEAAVRDARNDPSRRALRMFIAIRSRWAEDALAVAVAHGVRQLVQLGAGLDTYAYRGAMRERLRIFEVDHPATQVWKRERLAAAAIPLPGMLAFVPVDFEREPLADSLAAAGFDPTQPTFFTWLGVVPYLAEQAIFETLRFISGLSGGAHVVFDYANPPASFSEKARATHEALAARVAAVGEDFRSFFETDALLARLRALGFREIEDLGPAQIAARFFPDRASAASDRGGHILRASTV
jgi:methyltransferase (TIGR00027 family)